MNTPSVRIHSDGSPITERETKNGLRINIVAGATGIMWFVVFTNFPMVMLLESIGASALVMGFVAMAAQITMAIQIPATFYTEKLSTRKRFWGICTMIHRPMLFLAALLAYLMPHSSLTGWLIVLIMTASMGLAKCAEPLWLSWMADFVPERTRGRFYGVRQSISLVINLLSVAFAGWILDFFPEPGKPGGGFTGFLLLFGLASFMGFMDIFIHMWVPEPKPRLISHTRNWLERIKRPLREKNFLWLTCSLAVWTFSVAIIGPFGALYLKRAFSISYGQLAILSITGSIGAILANLLWGHLVDRIGARAFGVLVMIIAPLSQLGWFFVGSDMPGFLSRIISWSGLPVPICIIACTAPIAWSLYTGMMVCQLGMISDLAPKDGRTMAMAINSTIIGVLAAVGSVAGGAIVDAFPHPYLEWVMPSGTNFGFIHALLLAHMAIAWFIAVPLMVKVKPGSNDMSVGTAARRLLLVHPFRTARNIYNLGAVVSPWQRAAAAYELGRERSAIAVKDLIEKLEDPSADVREEAAIALGRIGSPDAVDALIHKLSDPSSDLHSKVARALRDARDPRSVDALLGKLSDNDRETKTETVRTLGAIGDKRASGSLLGLLRSTDDEKIAAASGEALACLGELAAIYELFPRMHSTINPALKRSMAIAVADLLGKRGVFYKALAKETESRCSEVENMLRRLRKTILAVATGEMLECGRSVNTSIRSLEAAYEAGDAKTASMLMFDIGIGIAALKHGINFGTDAKVFIEDLIWRDEHFGVGMWCLGLLREDSEDESRRCDNLDVLIGIHFLSSVDFSNPGRGMLENLSDEE